MKHGRRGLTDRFTSPLSEKDTALLDAIGMASAGWRVLVRRPVTVAIDRKAYVPGLAAALLTLVVSYRHGGPLMLLAAAAVAATAMTLSLVAHEAGHLFLGRHAKGITPRMIVLRSTGGVCLVEGRYETARGAALFSAGGPLATAIVIVSLVTGGLLLPMPFATALILPAALNAALLAVNLLPVAPMDGYMLFRSAVWAGVGNRAEAERRAIDWSRAVLGWAVFCSLLVFDHHAMYGFLALFFVATFTFQHHAVASRAAPAPRRAHRHS